VRPRPTCGRQSGAAVAANDVRRTESRSATGVTPSRRGEVGSSAAGPKPGRTSFSVKLGGARTTVPDHTETQLLDPFLLAHVSSRVMLRFRAESYLNVMAGIGHMEGVVRVALELNSQALTKQMADVVSLDEGSTVTFTDLRHCVEELERCAAPANDRRRP
jgi:hypothetical protein